MTSSIQKTVKKKNPAGDCEIGKFKVEKLSKLVLRRLDGTNPTKEQKLGVIIESAEIADAMKKIYELAWAEAKRLDISLRS